jgi:dinuclear metal center YbgI/SA1388 family protein
MVDRSTLISYLNEQLQVNQFEDYAPNGLQVEGKNEINKIVTGVTANQALIDAAIAHQADAVLVHHGFFWKGEDARIVGMKKNRIQAILKNDINLLAYHLPLDAHPSLGNNVQLGKVLGLNAEKFFGKNNIIAYTKLANPMTIDELSQLLEIKLNRRPLVVGPQNKSLQTIAWCTGAAQGYLHAAIEMGVDAYISGEVSEQTTHIAQENNIAYFAAGHHATERYGVKALGEHLAKIFELAHIHVDIDNPV